MKDMKVPYQGKRNVNNKIKVEQKCGSKGITLFGKQQLTSQHTMRKGHSGENEGFTDSQNGCAWKGPLKIICQNPLLKQDHLGCWSKTIPRLPLKISKRENVEPLSFCWTSSKNLE